MIFRVAVFQFYWYFYPSYKILCYQIIIDMLFCWDQMGYLSLALVIMCLYNLIISVLVLPADRLKYVYEKVVG